ncbi:MAG: metalloregulator ArsR/SmtB family transcription factor [Eubacteriales bacterium]|nr:metalloregulator ArsR/SmtB family transcription factor [Eubacteriales bacterium]
MSECKTPHDHGQCLEADFSHMPETEDFMIVSEVFKQLSDSSRMKLFWILCHCEECVINLSVMMDMSSPAISHHLKQLKAGGLITSRRAGKEVYYKAADTKEARMMHKAIEMLVEIRCPSQED